MKRLIVFHITIAMFISCVSQKELSETIKYTTYIQSKKVKYSMELPTGFMKYIVVGDHERELRYLFPDSSIIYITNDIEGGSPLNYDNIRRKDNGLFVQKLNNDTLYIEGLQENDLYWKECKLGRVTVGYVNVSKENKQLYDKALNSLKKK